MKCNYKNIVGILLALVMNVALAQEDTKQGKLSTTTTETLTYVDENGTKFPYTVTTQESRVYNANFEQSEENPENFNRKSTTAQVSKMITVESETNSALNGIIIVRYEKQLADTFDIVATDKGFAIEVDGKNMNYIVGKGVYFPESEDGDFFIVDEFDFTD